MCSRKTIMWVVAIVAAVLAPVAMAEVPVADAGEDQTIHICDATPIDVTLDGSGSYDPDGSDLTYAWTWDSGSQVGVGPTITLPPGEHVITLVVNDGTDDSPADQVTIEIITDASGPEVEVLFPAAHLALQNGVTLSALASDPSGVVAVSFSVRTPGISTPTPIPGYEGLPAALNVDSGEWELALDTAGLPDGYYVVLAKAEDNCGNEAWSEMVLVSIRNDVVPEVEEELPSSKDFNAGRTVPVKFVLKVPEAVDATQPYVYNEALEIRIYLVGDPDNTLLQVSVYGDTSTDYRLADSARHYITNFKTLGDPAAYLVEVWWLHDGLGEIFLGDFTFVTVPHPRENAAQVHRFWSPRFKKHFYTMNEGEKDKLRNKHAETWTYEDVAFYAFGEALEPEVVPVYRFYAPNLGAHFYTTAESEKNKLINKFAHAWTYEGIAFYAYPEGQQPADALPLYRFWSDSLRTHFFTSSETEKDKLIANHPDVWTYEGIAWYAY